MKELIKESEVKIMFEQKESFIPEIDHKPTMEVTLTVGNNTPLMHVNEIIKKMNEEHSDNYTLHYNITFNLS